MSNKLGSLATGSLAEFVWLTAEHRGKILSHRQDIVHGTSAYKDNTLWYQKIASVLPSVKRHSYVNSLLRLVDSTRSVDAEEIIGQLSHASFPFDQLWIEGRSLFAERWGALISTDKDKSQFTFKYVLERLDSPDHSYNRGGGRELQYFQDGKLLDTRAVDITVSMAGIAFDEDKLLDIMLGTSQVYKDKMNRSVDSSSIVNEIYNAADFLARTFVVLGSEHVPSDFAAPKTKEELELEAKNKRRMQMRRPPLLSTCPVQIDITKIDPKQLESPTAKDVRKLLGWTSVRRSKEIISKYGVRFTRKPHDRRIAADVDRRNVERELLAGDPRIAVEIRNDRPVQVRHDLQGVKEDDAKKL